MSRGLQTELLVHAGRLLLEYNESAGEIHRALTATARVLTDEPCHIAVSYNGVAVSLAREAPALHPVHELRFNTIVQARVHSILEQLGRGELELAAAVSQLQQVEADTPRHSRWVASLVLGVAAASLAGLLGADLSAALVAGVASALGLLARQELGRRHFSLLALPLTAAFIGSVLGGLAIQLGWTRTPGLVLIVPALMLVPGPHLINGVLDLIDNYLPLSLARLWLALGIVLASGLGVVLGVELTLPGPDLPENGASANRLTLASDMVLAGIVTCGFAVFYNTAWRQVGMAVVGGMAGHGLRFLALDAGARLEVATFLGGLAVGIVTGWIARSSKTPVAVIAFAGAVTMMPGLQMYRALSGALQMARLANEFEPAVMAGTVGNALQACLVVSGLALGLVIGARLVLALTRERVSPATVSARSRRADSGSLVSQCSGPSEAVGCLTERAPHDS
jgi:uncharacterized membrane protein YjjP (DUF1212 family)